MAFLDIGISLGINVGMWALNKYVLNEKRNLPKPKPDGLEFPLTEIGTRVPIVYGYMRVDNPCLVHTMLYGQRWESANQAYLYGATMVFVIGTPPHRDTPTTGAGGSPRLMGMYYGDKRVPFTNNAGVIIGGDITHGNAKIGWLDLGGPGAGGTFKAIIEFFDGRPDQKLTSYPSIPALQEIDKAYYRSAAAGSGLYRGYLSSYRHQMVACVIADVAYNGTNNAGEGWGYLSIGENATVAACGFLVACEGANGFSDTSHGESYLDANPAMVLYDLLCGTVFKLGLPTSKVDLASFEACAATLLGESHGCSLVISGEEDAPRVMASLLAQIDGVIYEDPITGKLKLRLVRADYDFGDLQEINASNIVGRPEIGVTGFADLANDVTVYFTNRDKEFKRDSVSVSRLSIAVGQDSRYRPREVDYPSVSNAPLATKLAAREANISCRPLMTVVCTVNREFADTILADVLKINLPQYGLTNKALRVLEVDDGQLAANKIRLTLVEDIFGNELGAPSVTPPSAVPSLEVLPVITRVFEEAPAWLISQAYYQGHISNLYDGRVLGAGRRESGQEASANVVSTANAGAYSVDVPARAMATSALVAVSYPHTAGPYDTSTGLVIEDVTGELAETFLNNPTANIFDGGLVATETQVRSGANLIFVGSVEDGRIVNGEFMAYEGVTVLGGGQYRLTRVWRELHDTAADDHPVGAAVFFIEYPRVGQRVQGLSTYTLTGKDQPVPTPFTGDQPVDQLDAIQYVNIGPIRQDREYPAKGLTVSAIEFPAGVAAIPAANYRALTAFEGSIDASWRQRIFDSTTVVRGDEDISTQIAPANTTYTFYGRKVGGTAIGIKSVLRDAGSSSMSTTGLLVGGAGHGEIDLLLRTQNSAGQDSWSDVRCRVSAHRARNLLGNSTAGYASLDPWLNTTGQGTMQTLSDSTGLGGGGSYFKPLTGVAS